ncbi:glycosyltransferase family 4 protein [Cellulomonas soli]
MGDLPMVLCVGTHEPRKNHGAVLHAAEVLWREGVEFSLTFVGGHSWRGQDFTRRLSELQAAGRAVESASGVDDELLWAAYRLARCTIFPSFNEGFGLPVAESLSAGTPAITSDYGSMREIAADGGALLVDPRDDASVTDALRRLLDASDGTRDELATAALARPRRTWDDYAAESWAFLAG